MLFRSSFESPADSGLTSLIISRVSLDCNSLTCLGVFFKSIVTEIKQIFLMCHKRPVFDLISGVENPSISKNWFSVVGQIVRSTSWHACIWALAHYSNWAGNLAMIARLYVSTFNLISFFWPLLFFEYREWLKLRLTVETAVSARLLLWYFFRYSFLLRL